MSKKSSPHQKFTANIPRSQSPRSSRYDSPQASQNIVQQQTSLISVAELEHHVSEPTNPSKSEEAEALNVATSSRKTPIRSKSFPFNKRPSPSPTKTYPFIKSAKASSSFERGSTVEQISKFDCSSSKETEGNVDDSNKPIFVPFGPTGTGSSSSHQKSKTQQQCRGLETRQDLPQVTDTPPTKDVIRPQATHQFPPNIFELIYSPKISQHTVQSSVQQQHLQASFSAVSSQQQQLQASFSAVSSQQQQLQASFSRRSDSEIELSKIFGPNSSPPPFLATPIHPSETVSSSSSSSKQALHLHTSATTATPTITLPSHSAEKIVHISPTKSAATCSTASVSDSPVKPSGKKRNLFGVLPASALPEGIARDHYLMRYLHANDDPLNSWIKHHRTLLKLAFTPRERIKADYMAHSTIALAKMMSIIVDKLKAGCSFDDEFLNTLRIASTILACNAQEFQSSLEDKQSQTHK